MTIENVALVNSLGQVVNHVIVDTDDTETMSALHEQWGTERHVVTAIDDVIILHESDEIWTTHCDDAKCETHGFNLPDKDKYLEAIGVKVESPITITERKISELPDDSWLLEKNAADRPEGWTFPADVKLIEG
jgi:hypothetical protein